MFFDVKKVLKNSGSVFSETDLFLNSISFVWFNELEMMYVSKCWIIARNKDISRILSNYGTLLGFRQTTGYKRRGILWRTGNNSLVCVRDLHNHASNSAVGCYATKRFGRFRMYFVYFRLHFVSVRHFCLC